MLHPKTRWVLDAADDRQLEQADTIASVLSLPPLVAGLLVKRGITKPEQAHSFLYGGAEEMHDPYLLKEMQEAADRIRAAGERGEKIRIYGDYDADGVSATSFMIRLFTSLGLKFDYYIPHRQLEGYGLNESALKKAADEGVSLIVTVDTGISAAEQIDYARSLNLDVIVTDHHEPPGTLPDAYAVVNPKLSDCPYPYKGLAGVGVAFKLGHALLGRPPLEWADIAALGTIADLMPLTGENRIIVRYGLTQLRQTANSGFRALADIAGIDLSAVTSTHVAFAMAPRINASGRLEHADGAVKLLTTDDPNTALVCAERLDRLNKQRQQIVDGIVEEALTMWKDKCDSCSAAGRKTPAVIVLASEGWNTGVIGIVASKLIEKFYRPAIIFGIDAETGTCKGSARSIEGFDLYAALTETADLLDHYGGHQAAAGMSLHRDRLPELEKMLGELAEQWLDDEDWIRKTAVDAECSIAEADLDTIGRLAMLEPFGTANPSPKLMFSKVEIEESRMIGKGGKHLRLALRERGKRLEAVAFGRGGIAKWLSQGARADIIGELSVNEWNGIRKPQLMLHDLRVDHVQLFDYRNDGSPQQTMMKWLQSADKSADPGKFVMLAGDVSAWAETAAASAVEESLPGAFSMEYIPYDELPPLIECSVLLVPECPSSADVLAQALQACRGLEAVVAVYSQDRRQRAGFPQRSHFAEVYQSLRRLRQPELRLQELLEQLSERLGWRKETIQMMLNVFAELEFITCRGGNVYVNPQPGKRELSDSALYRQAAAGFEADRILFAPYREFADWIQRNTSSGNS